MLTCSRCSQIVEESSLAWRCSCGGAFEWSSPEPLRRAAIRRDEAGMWRYVSSLPVTSHSSRISMGEGGTPLVQAEWNGVPVFFKLDFLCPTGSYKDRGMSCVVSRLKELGVKEVVEDSSGNAGSSMAAYCAIAGIHCRIYVPDYASQAKCVQIESSGAELVRVPGSREDTTLAAEEAARASYYASHNWNPYFPHGVKTFAFEIWEQMGFQAPDAVLLPAGQGSLVLGCSLAFDELFASGEIERLPRLYALQAENCSPLESAFRRGLPAPEPIEKRETIAEGISTAEPVRGGMVLDAVRKSGGAVLAYSERAIWEGFVKLAKIGLYVEPTSAIVGAALDDLEARGEIGEGERVAVLLSGSGLKATDKIVSLYETPPA
ncbi:MAG: threonine synthase [Synergistota bacterium]|nr:threonine synthase [Synergistota bacterium]OPZ40924.1 MAG: Threonine synthase [Synergistetes bacterium ADurb.BinA166]